MVRYECYKWQLVLLLAIGGLCAIAGMASANLRLAFEDGSGSRDHAAQFLIWMFAANLLVAVVGTTVFGVRSIRLFRSKVRGAHLRELRAAFPLLTAATSCWIGAYVARIVHAPTWVPEMFCTMNSALHIVFSASLLVGNKSLAISAVTGCASVLCSVALVLSLVAAGGLSAADQSVLSAFGEISIGCTAAALIFRTRRPSYALACGATLSAYAILEGHQHTWGVSNPILFFGAAGALKIGWLFLVNRMLDEAEDNARRPPTGPKPSAFPGPRAPRSRPSGQAPSKRYSGRASRKGSRRRGRSGHEARRERGASPSRLPASQCPGKIVARCFSHHARASACPHGSPSNASSSAETRSASTGRSPGSFARHDITSASSIAGVPGARVEIAGGAEWTCFRNSSPASSESNGLLPVSSQ